MIRRQVVSALGKTCLSRAGHRQPEPVRRRANRSARRFRRRSSPADEEPASASDTKLAAAIKKPADQIARVECATCHRGAAIPVTPPPPPAPAPAGAPAK